jgi:3-oxoacyl-[acyl-carrier-protein] synthase II
MICGTLFGGLHSIVSFDWSGLNDGPSYVNPMEFPNTVINSPAGQAAIRFHLRGINSTVCAGLASGLYALHYGAEALRRGRARALLCGGVEELCEESFLGFRKMGLASSAGCVRPFHPDSDGTVAGEGSALLVLESASAAKTRGLSPWAEIAGFGCAHDAKAINRYDPHADGATAAIRQAMESAGIEASEVGCIIAGANGTRAGDAMEFRALSNVFAAGLSRIPVSAPKASFGEAMGASGALCALGGAIALREGEAPATAGAGGVHERLRLSSQPQSFEQDFVLVNAFSCDGNNASLVLRRWSA